MKINNEFKQAVAAVSMIVHAPKGKALGAIEISKEIGAPLQQTQKILNTLKRNNLLMCKKGPGGGYQVTNKLAVKPNYGNVFVALEHNLFNYFIGDEEDEIKAEFILGLTSVKI